MLHVSKPELLAALKDCLHRMENTELISPDDLDIINNVKRILRNKIAELERETTNGHTAA
jgi:hypothetical protein